jgi:hypothetical protein
VRRESLTPKNYKQHTPSVKPARCDYTSRRCGMPRNDREKAAARGLASCSGAANFRCRCETAVTSRERIRADS